MKKPRMLAFLFVFLVGGASARGADHVVAPYEPGFGQYLLVLVNGSTTVPDSKTGKTPNEPDVKKHGGTLLQKKDNVRLIKLPIAAARALRNEENVAYLQRIWLGEPLDGWTSGLSSEGPAIQTDMETDLTWETGTYLYDGSGNIRKIGNDEYSYDASGRLIRANVKGQVETYAYDSFGNLVEKKRGSGTGTIPADPTTNRLQGESYDVAGNLETRDGQPRYVYDSLNMMESIKVGGTSRRRILYGPDEERIGVIHDASLTRWKLRDFDGHVLREFKDDGVAWQWMEDYVHGDGRILGAEREQYYLGRRHMHTDHLGSVRLVTAQDRTMISRHDFFPYGEEETDLNYEYTAWALPGDSEGRPDPMKFTGHERDFHGPYNWPNDDYLDYMHARYYDPNGGRFLSVDPGSDWVAGRPQTWNKYAYVRGNPMSATDPTGMYTYVIDVKAITDEIDTALGWFSDGMQALSSWYDERPTNTVWHVAQLRDANRLRDRAGDEVFASFQECREAGACYEFDDFPLMVGSLERGGIRLIGRNARYTARAILTDLPGDRAAAKSYFRYLTKGEKILQETVKDGSLRRFTADNRLSIRFKLDGTTRIDIKHLNGKIESIHYNK